MGSPEVEAELKKIRKILIKLLDVEIFSWLEKESNPSGRSFYRAATIIADRLCGAVADPIIRNAQEERQLTAIEKRLIRKGYKKSPIQKSLKYEDINPGEFAFRLNIKIEMSDMNRKINIPIDVVIKPKSAKKNTFPILIEAKSAGDFTNTNKRRKEEAMKLLQLKNTYGDNIKFALFLCGYFDSGYLGYEAAEGIDWVWEHRVSDFDKLGV